MTHIFIVVFNVSLMFYQLKQIRALVNNGAYEEHKSVFMRELEEMEGALIKNVKDLRSQVVKEACITVGLV